MSAETTTKVGTKSSTKPRPLTKLKVKPDVERMKKIYAALKIAAEITNRSAGRMKDAPRRIERYEQVNVIRGLIKDYSYFIWNRG